jgi:hypothetical protein
MRGDREQQADGGMEWMGDNWARAFIYRLREARDVCAKQQRAGVADQSRDGTGTRRRVWCARWPRPARQAEGTRGGSPFCLAAGATAGGGIVYSQIL